MREELEERIVARARVLRAEAEAFKRGESTLSGVELQEKIFDFFADAVPAMPIMGMAALALLDVAPLGIQIGAASRDWLAVAQAGTVLASAVMVIRHNSEGIDDRLERELGRFLGAHLDETLYAFTQLPETCHVGVHCDMLLDGGFVGRQFLQMAKPEVKRAWDLATGIIANGGAHLSDDQIRAKLAAGAWLSERQRGDVDPESLIATMLAWVRESVEVMSSVPDLSRVSKSGSADAAWAVMLEAVDQARNCVPEMRLAFAAAAGCMTPLAACESGRDIVYIIVGSAGGAAVRYHGGDEFRTAPEVLPLADADLIMVRRSAGVLDEAAKYPARDVEARSSAIDEVRVAVGLKIVGPILERWPSMKKVTFIPIGEAQRIPLFTAAVDGAQLGARVDAAIAPNAATVLVAAAARRVPTQRSARVMADPASGPLRLPWVAEEAVQVAAIYGQRPDLVVDYGDTADLSAVALRSSQTWHPKINATSEHVLSQVEDARVVHLACHGFVPSEEGLPGLLLHGRLTFDALEHHRFADGATVVLSACSVGRSISDAPFAQLGFPAMLLSTGASEVIAPSQPLLDCKETVALMVALHSRLRDGASASEALAGAISQAEQDGVSSAVWGSFEVYGAPPREVDR